MKKLPNPYEFYMINTNAGLYNNIPEQTIIDAIEAFKEYGRQIRDYTLQAASEKAQVLQ